MLHTTERCPSQPSWPASTERPKFTLPDVELLDSLHPALAYHPGPTRQRLCSTGKRAARLCVVERLSGEASARGWDPILFAGLHCMGETGSTYLAGLAVCVSTKQDHLRICGSDWTCLLPVGLSVWAEQQSVAVARCRTGFKQEDWPGSRCWVGQAVLPRSWRT